VAASRLTAALRLAGLVAVVGLSSVVTGSAQGAGGSSTGGAGVSSLSWSHTVASGSNRVLVVGVAAEYSSSSSCQASSVTYGGTALTRIGQAVAGTSIYQCASLWYLVAPAVGTASVSVSFGAALDGATAGAVTLFGIKQAAPDASNTSFSNSGATSTSVTTAAANSTVVDVFGSGQPLGDLAPGSGQTGQWSQDAGGTATSSGGSSTETVASAGSATLSWTQTGINRSAQVVAAFGPAVDTTPPNAFSIGSPSAGATVANGQVLSSSPTDNVSVASVDYRYCAGSSCTYASGTEIGSTTSGPPFTVTWSGQPADGTYTLIARATDPSGNHTDSSTTTVTVRNQAPCSGGSLGLTVPSSVAFPSLTLNGSDQTVSTTVALTPDDETGGGAGWNITGTSTTLTGSSRTLPTTATSVTTATVAAAGGNCSLPTNAIAYPVTLPAGTSPPTPVKLYNAAAGTGAGPATVTLTARVAVPANAFSTTYTSTWTLAIASGP
jgi:hypothetical protein